MPNFSAEHEGCARVLVVLELHLTRRAAHLGVQDSYIRDDIIHAFLHRAPGAIETVHLPSDGNTAIRRIIREQPIGPEEPPSA